MGSCVNKPQKTDTQIAKEKKRIESYLDKQSTKQQAYMDKEEEYENQKLRNQIIQNKIVVDLSPVEESDLMRKRKSTGCSSPDYEKKTSLCESQDCQ